MQISLCRREDHAEPKHKSAYLQPTIHDHFWWKQNKAKTKKKQKWLRVKSFFLKCEEGAAGMEILLSCLRSLILCVCVWWERRTMISNAYRKSEPLFSASQTHQWGENQKSRTRQLRRSVVVSELIRVISHYEFTIWDDRPLSPSLSCIVTLG